MVCLHLKQPNCSILVGMVLIWRKWELSLKSVWTESHHNRDPSSFKFKAAPSILFVWMKKNAAGFNCVALMNKMAAIILSLSHTHTHTHTQTHSDHLPPLSLISFSSMQALWTTHPCRSVSTMPSRRYNQDLSVSQCRLEITVAVATMEKRINYYLLLSSLSLLLR